MPHQLTIEDNQGNVVGFMSELVNPATKVPEKKLALLSEEKRFHRSKADIVNPDTLGIEKSDLPTWIGTKPEDELIDAELLPSLSPVEATEEPEAKGQIEKLMGIAPTVGVRSVEAPKTP